MPDPIDDFRPDNRRRPAFHNAAIAAGRRLEEGEKAPSYAASQGSSKSSVRRVKPRPEEGFEKLPAYDCSLYKEGVLDVDVELSKPFTMGNQSDWETRCVVLRGTQLSIYKTPSSSKKPFEHPDRLVRSYTLQHAEVGLASDLERVEYQPVSRKALMIPKLDRPRHFQQHPDWFAKRHYFIFRLRVEEQQLLFSSGSRTRIHEWIEALCAGIDLAPCLDTRAKSRNLSTPWSPYRAAALLASRRFVQHQAAIIAHLYPQLGTHQTAAAAAYGAEAAVDAHADEDDTNTAPTAPAPEANENDTDSESTTPVSRSPSRNSSSASSSRRASPSPSRAPVGAAAYTSLDLFDLPSSDTDPVTGKWAPLSTWTAQHEVQFRKRCLPALYRDSPRGENVICVPAAPGSAHLVLVQVDWETRTLRPLGPVPVTAVQGKAEEKSLGGRWARKAKRGKQERNQIVMDRMRSFGVV